MFVNQVVAENSKCNDTSSLVLPTSCAQVHLLIMSHTLIFKCLPVISFGVFVQPAWVHEQFEIRFGLRPFTGTLFPFHSCFSVITPCFSTAHLLQLAHEINKVRMGFMNHQFHHLLRENSSWKPTPFGTDSEWDFLKQRKEKENYLKSDLLK